MKIILIIKGFWNLFLQSIRLISKKNRDIYKKRLDICLKCKYLDDSFCSICGCYIYAKTTVNYKIDENNKSIDGCPQKYW